MVMNESLTLYDIRSTFLLLTWRITSLTWSCPDKSAEPPGTSFFMYIGPSLSEDDRIIKEFKLTTVSWAWALTGWYCNPATYRRSSLLIPESRWPLDVWWGFTTKIMFFFSGSIKQQSVYESQSADQLTMIQLPRGWIPSQRNSSCWS